MLAAYQPLSDKPSIITRDRQEWDSFAAHLFAFESSVALKRWKSAYETIKVSRRIDIDSLTDLSQTSHSSDILGTFAGVLLSGGIPADGKPVMGPKWPPTDSSTS